MAHVIYPKEIGFVVPPVNQGQLVEVAYGACDDGIVRRTTDRSTAVVSYEIADWEDLDGEYQPQNESPEVAEESWRDAAVSE